MNRTFLYLIVFVVLAIGVGYWYQNKLTSSESVSQQGAVTGTANPASVSCVDAGGTLEIVDTAALGGHVGYCHTKDGRVCEEWALYRDGSCVPSK